MLLEVYGKAILPFGKLTVYAGERLDGKQSILCFRLLPVYTLP